LLNAAETEDRIAQPMAIGVLSATDAMPYKALMLHAYEHAADAFTSTPAERSAEPDAWWGRRVAAPDGHNGHGFEPFGIEPLAPVLCGVAVLSWRTNVCRRNARAPRPA
jgi:hypothetical protein